MPDLDEIEKFLKAEWEVISGSPFLFVTAVVGIGILIWLASRFYYQRQIKGLEKENKAKDETIRTLGERVFLAQDKFEASDEARKDLETRFSDLEEAVEQDAAQRDQEVSADVKVATTATEGAIEGLKEKEDEVRNAFIDAKEILRKWQTSATKPDRVIIGEFSRILGAAKRSEDEVKGKDKD